MINKKVIFVVASMAGGGAERVIAILANQFVQQGIEVSIMMTAGEDVVYQLDRRVELVSIGGKTGGSMKARFMRIKKMRDYFKVNSPAVAVVFGLGASFFVVMANVFLKNKMIISERNDPNACTHPHLRNLVYSRADYMVYQTEMARDEFPEYLKKRSAVIANPISSNLPKRWGGKREKKVVAVGRLEKQKNYEMMLKAFAKFYEKHPEYQLHIFGKGYLESSLKKMADSLQISEAVVWEGFSRNVWRQIESAAMYILSSDYEGISNSMLEALGLGLPVISTDCPIGGSRMCIQNRENGILVPVGESQALAQAMCEVVEDEEFAKKIADNAYKIREKFSEENISGQWLNVISRL